MTIGKLKFLRFFVPSVLILIFIKILGLVTGWWETALPDFSKMQYLPTALIPGTLYYITPLRRWMNAPHHKRINENIRKELLNIGGLRDRPDIYTWKRLRSLFYSLLDEDKSLTRKGELAYFNGLIWTSCADSSVLSLMFSVLCVGLYLLGVQSCLLAMALFILIFVISAVGSIVTTKRQMDIGEEQLEIIRLKYSDNVAKHLASINE
jgi:hypothetical protein